jgi:hypothetical protein
MEPNEYIFYAASGLDCSSDGIARDLGRDGSASHGSLHAQVNDDERSKREHHHQDGEGPDP